MLGVLCARHKPWILNSISLLAYHQNRFVYSPIHVQSPERRRHHSTACRLGVGGGGLSVGGGAASIWHAILPSDGCSGCRRRRNGRRKPGEGSWNASSDERPARWLHRADSAWLLFGVCSCLAPIEYWTDSNDSNPETVTFYEEKISKIDGGGGGDDDLNVKRCEIINERPFKVTGIIMLLHRTNCFS